MRNDSHHIILTGASGYIGYNFTKYLVNKGFNVHLIVRSDSDLRDLNLLTTFVQIYNGEPESIEKAFINQNISLVIHLATYTDKSDNFSSLIKLNDVCLNLTNHLFGIIKKQNYQIGFINVGTVWQTHEQFSNAYSMYKSFQEELAKFYSIKYDIKVVSLLLSDTYGPNDWRPKLLNQLKEAVINGSEFQIINPNAKFDLVFIDDVCDALYKSMELVMNQKLNFSIYKIHAHKTIGLKDLVNSIEMIMGHSISLKFSEGKSTLKVEIEDSVNLLPGWTPRISLNTGLLRFFEEKG